MTFIAVPDGCKVTWAYTDGDTVCSNTLWYTQPGAWDQADMTALATAINNRLTADFDNLISEDFSGIDVKAYDMRSQDGPVSTVTSTWEGQVVGEAAPAQCAGVVTLRTGNRGRSGRGRIYIGGLSNTNITTNELSSGWVTAAITFLDGLVYATATAGWYWCVVSFQHNKVARDEGYAQFINSYEVRSAVLGTQRRRLPRA
jgi:hypothetical protein